MKTTDIPGTFKDWSSVIEFAATFSYKTEIPDGYPNRGLIDVSESSSVRDIRAALFLEYRRYNHFGRYPEETVFQDALHAIEILRHKVAPMA